MIAIVAHVYQKSNTGSHAEYVDHARSITIETPLQDMCKNIQIITWLACLNIISSGIGSADDIQVQSSVTSNGFPSIDDEKLTSICQTLKQVWTHIEWTAETEDNLQSSTRTNAMMPMDNVHVVSSRSLRWKEDLETLAEVNKVLSPVNLRHKRLYTGDLGKRVNF